MDFNEFAVDMVLRTDRPITEDELFAIAAFAAAGAGPGDTRVEATVVLNAENLFDAMARAVERVRACVAAKLVSVRAMTGEENARRINVPRLEPVGVLEVAELLGVSRQRVFQLMKRADFPAPFATLACGQIWRKGDLSTFIDSWKRKPGRPWPTKITEARHEA